MYVSPLHLYKFAAADTANAGARVRLFGSGAIMGEVLKARDLLRDRFGVQAEIWSATSYSELRHDAAGSREPSSPAPAGGFLWERQARTGWRTALSGLRPAGTLPPDFDLSGMSLS